MALVFLRLEFGLGLALDRPSNKVEFSRLLNGFLVKAARFPVVGIVGIGVDLVAVFVRVVLLVGAGAAGITDGVLLRAEALVVIVDSGAVEARFKDIVMLKVRLLRLFCTNSQIRSLINDREATPSCT